jgi:hypothetical protein
MAADTAPGPERVTVTVLDTSNDVSTVPLIQRLLVPAKLKVSLATLACVKALQYTPGANFRTKAPGKDFSETLKPLELFTDIFLKTMKQVKMTADAGENESALRCFLSETLPEIRASSELAKFFASWNIKVVRGDSRTHTPDAEFETNMSRAMEASILTAQSEATQRQDEGSIQDEDVAEQERKLLLRELDIVASALQHRLVRWAANLPRRSATDQLWPSTFTTEERKALRAYVLEYAKDADLLGEELSEQEKLNAIKAIQHADDFPIELARTASVIQAILLEVRFGDQRRSRSQSEATPSIASRNPSPVKGLSRTPRSADDDDMENSEEDDVVHRGKKRPRRSSTGIGSVNDDAQEDTEDDDEVYKDYQEPDRKRTRRRIAKGKEIAKRLDIDE